MESGCGTKIDRSGKERLERGNLQFPIGCYHNNLTMNSVPWHWHDELEAAVVTEGSAVIAVGSRRYLARAGDGFFINAGILHTCWSEGPSPCRFHSMVFHPRLVGGSLDSVYWQRYLQPLIENSSLESIILRREEADPWQERAVSFIEAAWRSCTGKKPGYEFAVRSALSDFIFELCVHTGTEPEQPSARPEREAERMKQMLELIHTHCAEELSLRQIAECASVSESECIRCFRNTIGKTPIQYLKMYRLQKAAGLLEKTGYKIIDIGVQCGFQDMSYFSRSFRAAYGCTPSEYRNGAKK